MTSLLYAREMSRSVLLKCCSVSSPTTLHRKIVRCLTRIYSSLDRVQQFSPFLLNCTANTLESLAAALDMISHLACIEKDLEDAKRRSSDDEEAELVNLLATLWKLYMDLNVGLQMQEVTTPAVHLLPKLKCRTSKETPRVKSPLARVSVTRFQRNDTEADAE